MKTVGLACKRHLCQQRACAHGGAAAGEYTRSSGPACWARCPDGAPREALLAASQVAPFGRVAYVHPWHAILQSVHQLALALLDFEVAAVGHCEDVHRVAQALGGHRIGDQRLRRRGGAQGGAAGWVGRWARRVAPGDRRHGAAVSGQAPRSTGRCLAPAASAGSQQQVGGPPPVRTWSMQAWPIEFGTSCVSSYHFQFSLYRTRRSTCRRRQGGQSWRGAVGCGRLLPRAAWLQTGTCHDVCGPSWSGQPQVAHHGCHGKGHGAMWLEIVDVECSCRCNKTAVFR